MSEYQYYEFLAIDHPLSARQQSEVRALSTRARITATSFTNEYQWGDFKGDPPTLMRRYYDAHLYFANWGTRRVMLRLPRAVLDPTQVELFCVDPYFSAQATKDHVILDFLSEDESGEVEWWEDDTQPSLAAVTGVRSELAAGDLRPLYLAWLAAYGAWERDEDAFDYATEGDEEPPVPVGLGQLTAPQRALADFLRLDESLLAAAAQASPPLAPARRDSRRTADAITHLPAADKDALLLDLAEGRGVQAQMALMRQLSEGRAAGSGVEAASRPRRTVAALLDAATEIRSADRFREQAARAEHEARLVREREQQRQERLAALALDPGAAWDTVESLIETRRQANYDAAVALLVDLKALAERDGHVHDFASDFDELRELHQRKSSLMDRFNTVDLHID
ncbi:hypothetical protein BIV57_07295 [Mangrovactinospora gilvigrisea]|uniref:Uncharacterized protein n=1 Tax=Mangrovactinospora gilvigrisea TaxID=1428644 RepID=A0A1J7C9A9_9ACTN|nr:hypothetical protein [Mangrovactinospora gilvigrisea]OIV38120.1 hypothetical protein BIV57_07295 [Mangrovactinospora gilvigrisea]